MCTSIALNCGDLYFGRNMDLEYSFEERILITPREYPFEFRRAGKRDRHLAIIGIGTVADGYPLYADAMNEKGLCIAGLNFPGFAHYFDDPASGKIAVSPFEFIPFMLRNCENIKEAREVLSEIQLVSIPFSRQIPLTPLHWHIADRCGSLVIESTVDGKHVYENPAGVLSNSPEFNFHLSNFNRYQNLTTKHLNNADDETANRISLGYGSIGLPGDFSSPSRFVKAAYLLKNSPKYEEENASVAQFFHILSSVSMVDGSVYGSEGKSHITKYSSCMDAERGIYYYTTYENSCPTAVDLHSEQLDSASLIEYPLLKIQQVLWQNK